MALARVQTVVADLGRHVGDGGDGEGTLGQEIGRILGVELLVRLIPTPRPRDSTLYTVAARQVYAAIAALFDQQRGFPRVAAASSQSW
jgi:hypothetical protein